MQNPKLQPQQIFFLCAGMLSCRVTGWGKTDQTLFYRLYISMCPDGLLSRTPLFHKESRVFFTCCQQTKPQYRYRYVRSSLSEYRTILSSVLSTGTEYSGVQVVVRYMLPVLAVPR